MLPGKSGFEVVSEMRQAGQFIPTLILTARGHSDDVLQGFASGADDYLTKPFDLTILIARIQGLLRRREWLRGPPDNPYERVANDVSPSAINRSHFDLLELRVRDQVFPLTLMEMNVLRYLIQHEGKPVSRKTMLEEVWGLHEDTDTRAIDNFIVRLRRYIEADPTKPRHLLTVRGVGYRFEAFPPESSLKLKEPAAARDHDLERNHADEGRVPRRLGSAGHAQDRTPMRSGSTGMKVPPSRDISVKTSKKLVIEKFPSVGPLIVVDPPCRGEPSCFDLYRAERGRACLRSQNWRIPTCRYHRHSANGSPIQGPCRCRQSRDTPVPQIDDRQSYRPDLRQVVPRNGVCSLPTAVAVRDHTGSSS